MKFLSLIFCLGLIFFPRADGQTIPFNFMRAPTPVIALRAAGTTLSQHVTTTSLVISAPAGLVSGDTEIAQVWTTNTGSAATISPPAGWTLIRSDAVVNGSNYVEQYFFYHRAGPSEPSTYTFTTSISSKNGGGAIVAYAGVSTNPVDAIACNSGVVSTTTNTAAAPAITTTHANDTVLFTALIPGNASLAPFNGTIAWYDNDTTNGFGMFTSEIALPSTGTTTAISNSMANGDDWSSCQVALTPATTISKRSVGAFAAVTGTVSQIVINKPPTIVAGDLLIAQIASEAGAVEAYTSSGWTALYTAPFVDGSYYFNGWYYKVATGSEPANYTFAATSSTYNNIVVGVIGSYSGINTSSPLDVASCATGTTYATVSPTITTTHANDHMLYSLVQFVNHGAIPGLVSGFNQRWFNSDATNSQTIYGADKTVPAAGTVLESTNSMQDNFFGAHSFFACQMALTP